MQEHSDIEYRWRSGGKDRSPALFGILYDVRRNRSCTAKEQPATNEQRDDGAEQQGLDDMRFASSQILYLRISGAVCSACSWDWSNVCSPFLTDSRSDGAKMIELPFAQQVVA